MSAPEFVVEFMKAYAELIAAVGWPLVTMIIFSFFIYYLDRIFNFFGRSKKKSPISWRRLELLLNYLEQQYQELPINTDREERRRMIAFQEIDRARKAMQKQDSDQVQESLFTLGSLAMESDKNLNKWKQEDHVFPPNEPEMLLPNQQVNKKNL